MEQIKRVALIGLGAIGSFIAPRLEQALGDQFYVIAEGERKRRLEQDGVVVNGITHHFRVLEPDGADTCADLIMIAVKWPALDEAIAAIKNHVGPGTIILPLLNGVDSERRCAAVYGEDRVLYSIMRAPVNRDGNQVTYDKNTGFIEFGEKENENRTPRVQAVADILDAAGIRYRIREDMIRAIWQKFLLNIGDNLPCALIGAPYKAIHTSGHVQAIRMAAMREVVAVARSMDVPLGEEDIEQLIEYAKKISPDSMPSTLQDLQAGRKTEIGMFSGELIRMAKEHGVPVPCNEFLFHSILALEEKNEGKFDV